ncbi:MAG: 30S ribosomal protein S6 [Pseudomonadales bacterium]|nr:30S ribosomal protein S6 [Candidatus Woesebacteria bacterium]MCB9801997.1 30S ribosomal protein S6 [Pseudomonadales bacterium]
MKLAKKTAARQYEVTYLIPSSLSTSEQKALHDAVQALISKHSGTVVNSDDWGVKELAYTIIVGGERYHEAVYTHLLADLDGATISKLEKDLGILKGVIRHLVVRADEADTSSTSKASTKASKETSEE